MSIREIAEGTQYIGVDERPILALTTTNWGSSPTLPVITAWKYLASTGSWSGMTSTCFPSGTGTTISSNTITMQNPFTPQTIGDVMRIEFKFTVSGSILEAFANVIIER